MGCKKLERIEIPPSVKRIDSHSFEGCENLTMISVDDNNNYYSSVDGVLYDKKKTTIYRVPEGRKGVFHINSSVETISASSFSNCSKLTKIVIPLSVKLIETEAFKNCTNISSLIIPQSVKKLHNQLFKGCKLNPLIISSEFEIMVIAKYGKENTYTYYQKQLEGIDPSSEVYLQPIMKDMVDRKLIATYNTTVHSLLDLVVNREVSPTCVTYRPFDSNVLTNCEFRLLNKDVQYSLDKMFENGLVPNSYYSVVSFYLKADEIGEIMSKDYFKTPYLMFSNNTPKVTNMGEAIISARTNIVNEETNAGFEWRKTDAPEVVPSKSAKAIVYDGVLEGIIKNVETDNYCQVRPYYQAANGSMYYGDWIGFDPSDFSYFEPTVRTYANVEIIDGAAILTGYVLQGTDEIKEQGFEYWQKGVTCI